MGSSSGTQTQTATKDPWSAQQPYLQDIFSQANQAYNSGAGSQYYPGSTVVPFSPDTQAGMDQVRNTASAAPFGLDQAQSLTSQTINGGGPNMQGVLGQAAQGGLQNPYLSGIGQAGAAPTTAGVDQITQGSQQATPYVQQMIQAGNTPTTAGMGALAQGAGANTGIQAIQDASNQKIQAGNPTLQATANGSMLNSNPYLDQTFNTEARQVADNTNAQFSLGGRYGSGAQTDVLSRNLGDLANQVYGQNYATERQNQLSAANSLNQYQGQDIANQMSGANSVAGLNESGLGRLSQYGQQLNATQADDTNRSLGAYGQAANYGSADLSRQMAGGQALAGINMNDTSRNLQAQSLLGQLGDSGINTQLNAANSYNQYGLNQASQGLSAVQGLTPLQQYQTSGAQALLGLGSTEEGQAQQQVQDQVNRWNFQQQAPWSTLGQYSGIIGGLGNLGGTTTSTMPTSSNPLMGAVGGAAAGSTLGVPGSILGALAGYFGTKQ